MKKWEKKAIKDVINNFDFQLCHDTMTKMGWTWFAGVPSVAALKKEATRQLKCLCEKNLSYVASGRFWAERHKKEEYLRLFFYVDQFDSTL